MTRYEQLQDKIHNSDIVCEYTASNGLIAHSIRVDGDYGIFFNENAFDSQSERYVALTHEYKHCKTGYMYNVSSPLLTMNICEAKAWRHTIEEIIPFNELIDVILTFVYADGLDIYQLSEHFGVMPDFMKTALEYYQHRL